MEYGVVAVWWVLLVALLGLGVPVASRLVPWARDGGAFVALPVSVIALFVPILWLGHVSFGPLVVFSVLVVYAAVSLALARRGLDVDWRSVGATVGVFTVAFAFLIAVRAADPGVYAGGGEKFLDYGLVRSILRGHVLPPEDFWFAGEHVVYYYGGHLVAAVLTTLAGTPVRYAYGPALATFYAMEVTAVYGLGRVLARARGYSAIAGGVFAALLFGIASNLRTPVRVVATVLPEGVSRGFADLVGIPYEQVPIHLETFSYWPASRVIPDTINEFPLFAYVNGDLHAHMTSVAVFLVCLTLLYAYWQTREGAVWRRRGLVYGAYPIALGVLLTVNTWSVPAGVGVAWLALAGAPADPWTLLPERARVTLSDIRAEVARPIVALALVVPLPLLALVWVWPFVSTVLLAGASKQHPELFPDRSPLGPFVLVHGAFLATFAAYLVRKTWRDANELALAAATVAAAVVLAALGWWLNLVGLFLVGPLVALGWFALRRRDAGFETVLVVAGAGLVVLLEFAYLNDAAGAGRFNTVFKLYAQVWALWALAGGVALAAFVPRLRDRAPDRSSVTDRVPRLDAGDAAKLAVVLLLVTSLCVPYAGLTLSRHFAGMGDASLDVYETAENQHGEEAAAIEWLDANVDGQPTIVSRPGLHVYQWRNPASSLTGIPTVAGWIHARNYHDADVYDQRVRDVNFIYTLTDAESRAVLLSVYDVQYIYYGPLEREKYGQVSFADEPGISVAYENAGVTIYAVNQSALATDLD